MAPAPLKPRRPDAILLLLAWIDAAISGAPDPAEDHVYLDVEERIRAKQLAKLSPVDRWLPSTTSDDVRRQLANRGVCGALLGDWDEASVFRAGLAGLTEQEARAVELQAEGHNEWEIAATMDRKRARMFASSLSVETVSRYIRGGQIKLRAFFSIAT